MVKRQLQRISLGSLFFIIGAISIFAQPKTMVSGKVISKEKQEVVDFATVYLKGTTYGCTTNEGLSGNFWLVSFKISYLCLPLFYETRTTPSCHPSGCAYRQL